MLKDMYVTLKNRTQSDIWGSLTDILSAKWVQYTFRYSAEISSRFIAQQN